MDGVRSITRVFDVFVFISDLQADVEGGRIGDVACIGLDTNTELSHYEE